jgi:peptidoglycan/xylan/chitin deacetylase (PgdA/CDA1 family)
MSLLKGIATCSPARAFWRGVLRQPPLILTYHRFANGANGGRGIAPAMLQRQLEVLGREGFAVMPLTELVAALEACHELPPRTIALTVDDGYEDFASTGAPIFLEHRMPVTVFLTTGFLDGQTWMWWDQLDVAVLYSQTTAQVDLLGAPFSLTWQSEAERRLAVHQLAVHLERMTTRDRENTLQSIFHQLGWKPPQRPPPAFMPMSWDQVRTLEVRGIRFGSHTVSHPILALSEHAVAAQEIEHAHRRIVAELPSAVPIVAYPNGADFAYGPREATIVEHAGLRAAVTMRVSFVTSRTRDALFAIPRVAAPADFTTFLQLVAGPEALRHRLREWRGGGRVGTSPTGDG